METPANLVRSTDFWFEDGTIIVQVENTLYRLHRGLLASRSTVFRDTFSIPQPEEESSTQIDGCPAVQLHDRAKDFTRFLTALHHYGPPNCPVANFFELRSILLLSDKYDVPVLREAMISVLVDLYPTSLKTWSARQPGTPAGYKANIAADFEALNLAVKMNIRPILPALMYEICTSEAYGINAIVFGYRSVKIQDLGYRKRCISAVPELARAQRRVLSYLEEPDSDCDEEEGGACDAERIRWLALELEDENVDPLKDDNANVWDDFSLCSSCLSSAKMVYQDARQKLWDDLPAIFDLGTWDELLA
ncbi:hypothetical protein C8R43DRAFT_1170098 [Mycena crocata]|nr:hypothetical protein C8R43DRAFT_1170098 [Mycena crocata]